MKDAGSLDRPTIYPRGATGLVAGLNMRKSTKQEYAESVARQ